MSKTIKIEGIEFKKDHKGPRSADQKAYLKKCLEGGEKIEALGARTFVSIKTLTDLAGGTPRQKDEAAAAAARAAKKANKVATLTIHEDNPAWAQAKKFEDAKKAEADKAKAEQKRGQKLEKMKARAAALAEKIAKEEAFLRAEQAGVLAKKSK